MNNTLQDSATLVGELVSVKRGEKSLAKSVQANEKAMKERTLLEMPISVRTARLGHDWEGLMEMPAIRMGINRYSAERSVKNEGVQLPSFSNHQLSKG